MEILEIAKFFAAEVRYQHWNTMDMLKTSLFALLLIGNPVNADEPAKPVTPPVYQTIDESIAKGDLADVRAHVAANPKSVKKGGRETSRPPLEQAVMRNKADIALYLLQAGADPNTVNATQRTPLHLAVDRNNPVVAAALLKAGAKPNAPDKDGWTPLHHAAAKNQLETAKAILAGGADPMTLSNARRHAPARSGCQRRCGNHPAAAGSQGGSQGGLEGGRHRARSGKEIQEPAGDRRAVQVVRLTSSRGEQAVFRAEQIGRDE